MSTFRNPFAPIERVQKQDDTPSSRARRSTPMHSEGIVGPGKVISKAERQHRRSEAEQLQAREEAERAQRRKSKQDDTVRADSTLSMTDGNKDEKAENTEKAEKTEEEKRHEYEYSFIALVDKVLAAPRSWSWFSTLGRRIDEDFAPGACVHVFGQFRSDRRPNSVRALTILTILLFIVFGALYNVVECLLSATRASACDVSTVYIPVTETVTATMEDPSANALGHPASDQRLGSSISTHTVTSFVTVPAITRSTLPFVFTVDPSGSTHWINGVSPSSGVSMVTATTSVFVQPSDPPSVDDPQTTADVTYLTFPTYTSTVYSFTTPDLTVTSTSTSTHYVTYTVESVQRVKSITTTRSFSGMASGGWNATSSTPQAVSPAALTSMDPASTIETSVYFTPISEDSTSTTTIFTTTTIALRYTTTVWPSANPSGYVTTITALPVTISGPGNKPPTNLSIVSSSVNGTLVDPITVAMSRTSIPGASPIESLSPYTGSSPISPATASIPPSSLGLTSTLSSAGTWSILFSANSTSSALASPVTTRRTSSSMVLSAASVSSSSTASPGRVNSITYTIAYGESTSTNVPAPSSGPASYTNTSMAPATSTPPSVGSSLDPEAASTGSPSSLPGSIATIFNTDNTRTTRVASTSTVNATQSLSTRSVSTESTFVPSSDASSIGPASAASTETPLPHPSSPAEPTVHSSGFTISANYSVTSVYATNTRRTSSASTTSFSAITSSTSSAPSTSSKSTTHSVATSGSAPTETGDTQRSGHQSTSSSASKTTMMTLSSSTMGVNKTTSNPFPATSATAIPSAGCGEHGNFMMDFDDLPNFMPTENDTTITEAPPIFSPYHHLTFSDGYVYAPAPAEPYSPISPPHLAVFLGNATGIGSKSRSDDLVKPGEIGDGPRESISAFWFDANSAWFGCDNPGPEVCTLVFSAFTWSAVTKKEELTFHENATVPPCPDFKGCHLKKVEFPTSFRSLTGLQIQAFVEDEPKIFFMDNLAMRWANNTCAAGLLRQSSR